MVKSGMVAIVMGGCLLAGAAIAQTEKEPVLSCEYCDLRGAQMGVEEYLGRNLSFATLTGADFRGADLSNIVFLGANLSGADLRGTTLTNTFFTGGANLESADLRGAEMHGTFFTNAKLRNADLRGANLTKGSLESADLTGAKIDGLVISETYFCDTIMPDGSVRNDDC